MHPALPASEACEQTLGAQLQKASDSWQSPPQAEIQQLSSQLLKGGEQETLSRFEAVLYFGLPLITLVSAQCSPFLETYPNLGVLI